MIIGGYITRSNLPTPLGNLNIQVDPYWLLTGDASEAADQSYGNGLQIAASALKTVWADSPYVAGKQLVLATPDNSTVSLRLICDGTSMADAQAKAAAIATAVTQQMTFQLNVSYDTGIYQANFTWNCYAGNYEIAVNQMYLFGYLLPMYVTLPRDPTPVAGGI